MKKLEVFFDYACPYCLRGHEFLLEILPKFPKIEVEWYPCEAHPRPEDHPPHSDLLARGMYIADDMGVDLAEYHLKMYKAALKDHENIEEIGTVARLVEGLTTDSDKFRKTLLDGAYLGKLNENNQLAWEKYDFPAVPSFRMGEKLLKSVPGVGVTREMLEELLRG